MVELLMDRQVLNTGSCPHCGSGRIRVLRTERPRRRLVCQICNRRWWTLEVIETPNGGWLPCLVEVLLHQGRLATLPWAIREKLLFIAGERYR